MRIACVGRRSPDGSPCEVSGPPTTTASSIVDIRHTRPALRLRVRRGDERAAYPVRKLNDETRESTQRAHTSAEREQKFTYDTSIAPIGGPVATADISAVATGPSSGRNQVTLGAINTLQRSNC